MNRMPPASTCHVSRDAACLVLDLDLGLVLVLDLVLVLVLVLDLFVICKNFITLQLH